MLARRLPAARAMAARRLRAGRRQCYSQGHRQDSRHRQGRCPGPLPPAAPPHPPQPDGGGDDRGPGRLLLRTRRPALRLCRPPHLRHRAALAGRPGIAVLIGRPGRRGRSDGGGVTVMIGGLARGGRPARRGLASSRGRAVLRVPAGPLGRPARGRGVVGVEARWPSVLAWRHIHGRPGRGRGVVGVEAKRLSVLAGTRFRGRPPRSPGSIGFGATGIHRFRRPPTRPRICCRHRRQQRRTSTPCAHGYSPPRRHIAMTRPDGRSGTI